MCGKRLDLAGIQLGHLTVLEATDHRSSQGSIIWRCRCDCGNEILLPSSSIRNSHIEQIADVEDQNVMPMQISQGRDLGD